MDEVLAAVLGTGVRTTGVLPGDGGATTRAVTGPDGERLVVKTVPAGAAPDLLRAARAQELARRAGVPVPRTLAAEVVAGTQVHVTERVVGRRWSDVHPHLGDEDRRVVLGELGDVLVRLRAVQRDGFGELDAPPASERDALRARTRARVPDGWRLDAAERVLDRLAAPAGDDDWDGDDDRDGDGRGAVLVHGDLHHANVLVRPDGPRWRLAAVLDWDSAWAGPADADAARAALWDGMPGSPADPDARTAAHQLLWCLEYEDDGPRHRADTARLAARLGIPL